MKPEIKNIRINDPYIDHFPSIEELIEDAKLSGKLSGIEPEYNFEEELTKAEIEELFKKRDNINSYQ